MPCHWEHCRHTYTYSTPSTYTLNPKHLINQSNHIAILKLKQTFSIFGYLIHCAGIAVVCVMLITTALVALVMLMVWKTSILWISLFVIFIGGIEAVYLSAVLSKFIKGGYLPVALAIVLMLMMGIWHYVHVKHYKFELEHKVSGDYIHELAADRSITRIPGIGLLYSELVQGIPPIFPHFIDKIPSIHSVLVFVSVKRLPISKVESDERFLFRQIEPRELRLFKCVVRYGYKDSMEEAGDFEKSLVKNLKEFIHHEIFVRAGDPSPEISPSEESETAAGCKPRREASNGGIQERQGSSNYSSGSIVRSNCNGSSNSSSSAGGKAGAVVAEVEEETRFVQKEMEKGVVYLLGETEMVAKPSSSIIKRMAVNRIYRIMRRNFRQGDEAMLIPKGRLLKIGITYEI